MISAAWPFLLLMAGAVAVDVHAAVGAAVAGDLVGFLLQSGGHLLPRPDAQLEKSKNKEVSKVKRLNKGLPTISYFFSSN